MSAAEKSEDSPWGDPSRRTLLANERTYLAWWRTGLTALAVGLGSAKLVPSVAKVTQWPYSAVGAGFTLLGVVCIGYAERRRREVERAAMAGDWAPPDHRVTTALAVGGVLLGLALLSVVIATA